MGSDDKAERIVMAVLLLCIMYYLISTTVYQFRHPEKTSTQRLLNTVDALFWR